MKKNSIALLGMVVFLYLLPQAYGLERYVTTTITSFQDTTGTEIAFQGTGMSTLWTFCVDGDCSVRQGNTMIKAGWALTTGPFSWAAGTHKVRIMIEGGLLYDIRMLQADGVTPRAWRIDRINFGDCPLNHPYNEVSYSPTWEGNDQMSALEGQWFAGSSDADGSATAGYADVDTCINGRFEWNFFFEG